MSNLTHDKEAHEWREDDSSTDPNIVALAASYVPGSAEEKAFLWKIDKRIVVSLYHQYLPDTTMLTNTM